MPERSTTEFGQYGQYGHYGHYLEGLLGQQLARLRRRYLIHGLGWLLLALVCMALVYYPTDRLLRLPAGVRGLLSLGLLTWLVLLLRAWILYPLRRKLTRKDMALAVEERFPDLRQKLISALQLGRSTELRNQSAAMIEKLLADATEHSRKIPLGELLDAKRTGKVWAASTALLLSLLFVFWQNPTAAGVFGQRVLGMDVPYPRATTLVLESPSAQDQASSEYRVERQAREMTVTMAAGGDLAVVVRVEGTVPREVSLRVSGGRGLPPQISMTSRGRDRFKHVFRRVAGDFGFHARGGDDWRGDVYVSVMVTEPPRVGTVRATIDYPAYTHKAQAVQTGGSLEALIGSKVQLDVSTTTEVKSAEIEFLESGLNLTLIPTPTLIEDNGGRRTFYRGMFTLQNSDRYKVHLRGTTGLANPHPGTYHIVGVPDLAPVGRILSPVDDELNVVLPDGIIPLRVQAQDDFGLVLAEAEFQAGEGTPARKIELFKLDEGEGATSAEPVKQKTLLALIDLLGSDGKKSTVGVGQTILIRTRLVDNRQPEPGVKELAARQVYVVGETDLMRRVSGHFRRIRDEAEKSLKLQKDRREQLDSVIEDLRAGVPQRKLGLAIATVEVGQGRIQGASGRIHRELMRAFDFHLFNRLETSAHAARVLEYYTSFHEGNEDGRSHIPAFYADLSQMRQKGRLGAMEKALDPILRMIAAGARLSQGLAPKALKLLVMARIAKDGNQALASLETASTVQASMIKVFEALLAGLYEWNEFQDVITNTRSLKDKQRDAESRMKSLEASSGDSKRKSR